MRIPAIAIITTLLALSGNTDLGAQNYPDFSGNWQFDPTRSTGPVPTSPALRPNNSSRVAFRLPRAVGSGGTRSGSVPPDRAVEQTQPIDQRSAGKLMIDSANRVEQELVVTQKNGVLRIEQSTDKVSEKFVFRLDGSESKNRFHIGSGSVVEISFNSRWDGQDLVIGGSGIEKTDQGEVTASVTQTISLSEDGATLTIESVIESSHGRTHRSYVYTRR